MPALMLLPRSVAFKMPRGGECMKIRSLLLIVMAFLVGPIAFVSTAVGQQDNFWRDFGDWESRNRVLNGDPLRWEISSPSQRSLGARQRFWDLKRMRALSLELQQAFSPSGALDLKFVAKSAEEVNQRAKRLKSNLSLSKAKRRNRKEVEVNLDELRASLPMLKSAITDFLDNPALENARAGDAKLRIKAAGDLREVIELSDWVKKSSKKLGKSTGIH